uniref:DUF63 family protein n=1 Tax=Geoglobus ahangari TaxID=113653 RepID=A0A7C3YMP6_9EURY
MDLGDFLKKYFINSIIYKEGYNIVNTLTFAVILVVVAYLIYKYLSKRIDFDLKFAVSTFPYILFGSSLRIVEDADFIQPPLSYLLMTPLIYVVVFTITISSLIFSLKFCRKCYPYIGVALSISVLGYLFLNLNVENWWVFPAAISISSIVLLVYHYFSDKFRADEYSKAVLFAQLMDGSTSFIGMQFLGYWELHVIPRYLVSVTGAWVMVLVKVIVIVPVLFVLDSSKEDIKLIRFIKFVLFTLGFAPGLRNGLRMTFGV